MYLLVDNNENEQYILINNSGLDLFMQYMQFVCFAFSAGDLNFKLRSMFTKIHLVKKGKWAGKSDKQDKLDNTGTRIVTVPQLSSQILQLKRQHVKRHVCMSQPIASFTFYAT